MGKNAFSFLKVFLSYQTKWDGLTSTSQMTSLINVFLFLKRIDMYLSIYTIICLFILVHLSYSWLFVYEDPTGKAIIFKKIELD